MTENVYEYVCPFCFKVIKYPYSVDEIRKSKINILYCSGCGTNLFNPPFCRLYGEESKGKE